MRIFISLIAMLFAMPALAEPLLPTRSVSVSAEAEVKAAPDKVDVSIGLNEAAIKLADARKSVDDQLKALYVIAEKLEIAEKDMETMYSSVQPEYRYEDNKRIFTGYRVMHQLRVTLRKTDKLAEFLDAVLEAGIDEIHNTQYGVQEKDELTEKALAKAMEKARRKALVMAGAAGAKLGRVLTISEGAQVMQPYPQPMMRGMAMMEMASSDASAAPPAGEIEVQATVSVMYELED